MKTSTVVSIVVVALVVIGGIYWFTQQGSNVQPVSQPTSNQPSTSMPANSQPVPQPTPAPASAHAAVSIANFAFNPGTITVKIGSTVTWKNNDSAAHTVTSDTGSFASQTLSPGASYGHTFSSVGTFSYHCAIHPSMHGTVVVTQ